MLNSNYSIRKHILSELEKIKANSNHLHSLIEKIPQNEEVIESIESFITIIVNIIRQFQDHASIIFTDDLKPIKVFSEQIAASPQITKQEDAAKAAEQIIASANTINTLCETINHQDGKKTVFESSEAKSIRTIQNDIKSLAIEIHEANVRISTLTKESQKIFNEARRVSDEAKKDLDIKLSQINDLSSDFAGSVFAQEYSTSAAREERLANTLRTISTILMLSVAAIAAFSFWETTQNQLIWGIAAQRLAFAIIISIPAAYLARESTKHRQQQYSFQQISLDLKAITPYISTLPEEIQHKIKIDFAEKIFGRETNESLHIDTYPINAQEIILSLIKKTKENKS